MKRLMAAGSVEMFPRPLPPALQGHQRRQALPQALGLATRWDYCGFRINLRPFPPHPPTEWLRAKKGQLGSEGRGSIGFYDLGTRRHLGKSVDRDRCNYVTHRGTKLIARFARFENPRNALFYPRIWLFLPHVGFLIFAPISLSISLFLEERESNEREKAQKTQSTGRPTCNKVSPRIGIEIHALPWMVVDGETLHSCGLQPDWGGHPRSTGRNAYVPAASAGQRAAR